MHVHHPVPLSALDLSVVAEGTSSGAALADTTLLAQRTLGLLRNVCSSPGNNNSVTSFLAACSATNIWAGTATRYAQEYHAVALGNASPTLHSSRMPNSYAEVGFLTNLFEQAWRRGCVDAHRKLWYSGCGQVNAKFQRLSRVA
jgi:hypothetical protein